MSVLVTVAEKPLRPRNASTRRASTLSRGTPVTADTTEVVVDSDVSGVDRTLGDDADGAIEGIDVDARIADVSAPSLEQPTTETQTATHTPMNLRITI